MLIKVILAERSEREEFTMYGVSQISISKSTFQFQTFLSLPIIFTVYHFRLYKYHNNLYYDSFYFHKKKKKKRKNVQTYSWNSSRDQR